MNKGIELKSRAFLSNNLMMNRSVKRADAKPINPKEEDFCKFLNINKNKTLCKSMLTLIQEANYMVRRLMYNFILDPSDEQAENPVLRIFGITENKNSVCLLIENFFPYFYVKMPTEFKKSDIPNFTNQLEVRHFINTSNLRKS